jgi:hypothetical protein
MPSCTFCDLVPGQALVEKFCHKAQKGRILAHHTSTSTNYTSGGEGGVRGQGYQMKAIVGNLH